MQHGRAALLVLDLVAGLRDAMAAGGIVLERHARDGNGSQVTHLHSLHQRQFEGKMSTGTADIAEARRLGYEHGLQSGDEIDRQIVRCCWTRWADAEIEAYLRGRRRPEPDAGIRTPELCPDRINQAKLVSPRLHAPSVQHGRSGG